MRLELISRIMVPNELMKCQDQADVAVGPSRCHCLRAARASQPPVFSSVTEGNNKSDIISTRPAGTVRRRLDEFKERNVHVFETKLYAVHLNFTKSFLGIPRR